MGEAPLIVGVSGLRGIVGQSLTPEVAVRFAGALGAWLRGRTPRPRVAVGHDGRRGGRELAHVAMGALAGTGASVESIGPSTTPTMGCVVDGRGLDAGVMITASHNPQEWNGLKVILGEPDGACAPSAATARAIVEAFEHGPGAGVGAAWVGAAEAGRVIEVDGSIGRHVEPLLARARTLGFGGERGSAGGGGGGGGGRWTIVLDSVNCAGAAAAAMALPREAFHVVQLHGDGSGIFPHAPEPTAENLSGPGGLCDAVPGLRADIGLAQDPDADRLAIVDETGRYIGEEYTLALCAESVLSARGMAGAGAGAPVLVANLSTSRMIDDVAGVYGAEVVRTPVGEANVVERMKALRRLGREVVLGGEGNGGVIWPGVVHVRDSLGAMALVLAMMARTGLRVSELVARINGYSPGGQGYAIRKHKTPIASKAAAEPAVRALARAYAAERVDLQDGVRIDFGARGPRSGVWVHVRASNTEPIMRLICEAPSTAVADEVLAEVSGVIHG